MANPLAALLHTLDGIEGAGEGEELREGSGGAAIGGRPVTAVFLVVLINVVGFGVVIPLLPFYAAEFGASAFTVGLLFAAFGATEVIGIPILGYLADRWGRRPILLLSLLGSVVGFVLLGAAQGLAMLFLARVVDGATGGNISTARAVIADVTPPERRAKAYGVMGSAFGFGLILGPALGGVLSVFGYRVPAFAAAGLALAAAGLTWRWLPETRPDGAAPRGLPWTEARRLLRRATVRRYLATDLGWWCAFGAYQTTLPLFVADRLGYGAVGTGLIFAYLGAINATVQLRLIGPVAAKLGDRRALAAGLALGGAGLVAVAAAPSLPLVLLGLLPASIGIALANPSLASLVSQTVPPEEEGRLQGVSGASESLGRGIGPVWGNGLLGIAGGGVAYATVGLWLLGLALWTRGLPEPDEGGS